ncbi:single-stranded DNA-binding protein [Pendulispora brunnea]|uniref:Single-stranded DNA-binding protein n=1 Tax=Pendulispora brunnea TaxID=2905690 RepID=A0ABZ2KN35_9BACT
MAEGLNKVLLLGNLGADPELRVTPGGQAILKLRLATTETYLDRNNARQERTEWHQVTVWGKRGEALAKILSKGSSIFVEGSLRTSSYEKDGEKRYRTDIVANNIILAGGRRGGGDQPYEGGGGGRPERSSYGNRGGGGGGGDSGGGSWGGGGGGGGGGRSQQPAAPAQDPGDDYGSGFGGGDDDIPF